MDKKRTAFANRICNEKSYLQTDLLADLHVTLPRQNTRLEAALEDMWKRKVRHVILCGDLTNNGYSFQMKQVLTQLQEFPIHVLAALGNHDLYNIFSRTQNRIHPEYRKLLPRHAESIYFDQYVEGIHFYILNSEQPSKNDMILSHKQVDWLLNGLKQDDKSKPVCIIAHQPLQDTHPRSEQHTGTQQQLTTDMLKALHPHILLSADICITALHCVRYWLKITYSLSICPPLSVSSMEIHRIRSGFIYASIQIFSICGHGIIKKDAGFYPMNISLT